MNKELIHKFTRMALVVLMGGMTTTSCIFTADNAAINGEATDDVANGGKAIIVLSDIHVVAPELVNTENTDDGTNEPKLLQYSAEILEQVVGNALKAKPDLVLITGDLTEGGDLASHKQVVSTLSKLRTEGIKVAVIPGNHDINHGTTPTTPQQFAELYKDMGYDMAYAKDEASLSYVCEPFDGLVLLCIDTATGSIADASLAWLLDEADKAREKGKQVVALQHHNLVEHYDGHSTLQTRYILNNYEEVGKKMMKHGIHLVMTGHTHVNDIAQYKTEADSLIDLETGSLLAYPNAWRNIKVNSNFTKWDVSTEYVKQIPSVADVQKLSYQLYMNHLPSIVKNNADVLWPTLDGHRSMLTEAELSENIIPTTIEEFREWFAAGMSEKMCQTFMMHFEGNEGKNPKAVALVDEVREQLVGMFSKRLAEYNAPEEKTAALTLFVGAYYDEIFKPIMESMLTDTNQLKEPKNKSVTDDLNTVLRLGRK